MATGASAVSMTSIQLSLVDRQRGEWNQKLEHPDTIGAQDIGQYMAVMTAIEAGAILIYAAKRGDLNSVKLLCIREDLTGIGEAFVGAAENNKIEVMDHLSSEKNVHINTQILENALAKAAEKNNLDAVVFFQPFFKNVISLQTLRNARTLATDDVVIRYLDAHINYVAPGKKSSFCNLV